VDNQRGSQPAHLIAHSPEKRSPGKQTGKSRKSQQRKNAECAWVTDPKTHTHACQEFELEQGTEKFTLSAPEIYKV